MLAEQGIVAPDDARAIRGALDAVDLDGVRARGLRRIVRRPVLLRRTAASPRRAAPMSAGRLHTARSRNDIDMTMYRMRLREWLLDAGRGRVWSCATALLDLGRRGIATRSFRRTRTRQPAQPTTVAHYLLAVDRAARARHRPACGRLRDRPIAVRSARARSPARDFRSTASGRARCSASRARPATPTAASRRSTICSRAPSAARSCWSGSDASCRTCCCGATRRGGLSAAAGRLRAGEQHHAAEAQSRGARARAGAGVEGARRR